MSVGGTNILPKLSNAECEDIETYKEYKSGASYEGHLEGNFKAGYGTFTWPNGAQYKGEFVNNVRHGKGRQVFVLVNYLSFCVSLSTTLSPITLFALLISTLNFTWRLTMSKPYITIIS